MTTIYTALLAARKDFAPLRESGYNPHFKNKFSTLNDVYAAVVPGLMKNGLVLSHPIDGEGIGSRVTHAESGEHVESRLPLPAQTDPQKLGSAVSYFKRYTLIALLALSDVDDDGNASSPQSTANGSQRASQPPQNGGGKDTAKDVLSRMMGDMSKQLGSGGVWDKDTNGDFTRLSMLKQQVLDEVFDGKQYADVRDGMPLPEIKHRLRDIYPDVIARAVKAKASWSGEGVPF